LRDLFAAEFDPDAGMLSLRHQIAGLPRYFAERLVQALRHVDGHLLGRGLRLVGELAHLLRRPVGELAPVSAAVAPRRRRYRALARLRGATGLPGYFIPSRLRLGTSGSLSGKPSYS